MTEYGAMLPASGNIYIRGTLEAVTAWIADFSAVTPLQLVTRECTGDSRGHWNA